MPVERTSRRSAKSAIEAPIWHQYLRIRSDNAQSTGSSSNNGILRIRKRAKPSAGSNSSVDSLWIPAMPLRRLAPSGEDDKQATLTRIRSFWEKLSGPERQQILFIDDPDLVKQLYKLNLSLLCVGLMQRHLKAPAKITAAAPKANSDSSGALALNASDPAAGKDPIASADVTEEKKLFVQPTTVALEKAYELLEAMEFMDIGTGILTVKSELVDDPARLFALVDDVLRGFLTTVHVLPEEHFRALFVKESEVISSWEDYERIIGMLIEQLILKSYLSFLEKEAAIQMEELLLEVSLEDNKENVPVQKSKKKKKKKKKPFALHKADQVKSLQGIRSSSSSNDSDSAKTEASSVLSASTSPARVSKENVAKERLPNEPPKVVSVLNPNAIEYQPKETLPTSFVGGNYSSPVAGKRKLDKYIINVDWQDFEHDDENDEISIGYGAHGYYGEVFGQDDGFRRRMYGKQLLPNEETAQLEWQLQQMYSSMSSKFGWDFTNQRELIPEPRLVLPWNDSSLWRTAPREVVRYFTPGIDDTFVPFQPPPAAGPPQSRFYFAPPTSSASSTSAPASALLPPSPYLPVAMPAPPPHHHHHGQRMFAFQDMPVVSPAEFSGPRK